MEGYIQEEKEETIIHHAPVYSKKRRAKEKSLVFLIFVLLMVVGALFLLNSYSGMPAPIINVSTPNEKTVVNDAQIFVKGKVSPPNAEVKINDKSVAKNGNGEFTAIVDIPLGKSIISINSKIHGKDSNMVFPIERKRNAEEEKEYQEKLARDKTLEDEKVMGLKDKVVDAVNKLQDVQSLIRITDQQIATTGAQKKINGSIYNAGTIDAFDVKIIATLFNASNSVVGVEEIIVTQPSSPLLSGQQLSFSSNFITKQFNTFKLYVEAKAASAVSPSTQSASVTIAPVSTAQ